MKQNELETNLQSLSKTDLHFILWYVRLRWLRHKVSQLQPAQILIPTSIMQIAVFILSAYHAQNFILTASIGNLIVVGLALLPSTFPRPLKAHWVSSPKSSFDLGEGREGV